MSHFARSAASRSLSLALPGLSKKNFPLQLLPSTPGRKNFVLQTNIRSQKTTVRNFSYASKFFVKNSVKMALQAPPKDLLAPMNVPQKLLMVNIKVNTTKSDS